MFESTGLPQGWVVRLAESVECGTSMRQVVSWLALVSFNPLFAVAQEACRLMDEIWVPSAWGAARFIAAGVPETKVFVVPEACDTQVGTLMSQCEITVKNAVCCRRRLSHTAF